MNTAGPGMTQTQGGALPGPAPNTAGPHGNDLLNRVDPTVDAMSGGTQVLGPGINNSKQGQAPTTHSTTGTAGHHVTPGHNTMGTTGTTGHHVAPRHENVGATGMGMHGTTRTHQMPQENVPEGTYGPHSSRVANAADPRVDSDRDSRAHHHAGGPTTTVHQKGPTVQPGPASKTAGPHSSNLLNKLDPKVDSKATIIQQSEYRTS